MEMEEGGMEKELEGGRGRGREKGCRKRVEGQGRDGRKEERSLFYMYLCMTVLILVIL